MYTRYYDGYTSRNPQPAPVVEMPAEDEAPKEDVQIAAEATKAQESSVASLPFNLPFNMQTDDLILIAVLFLIASESNDDFILPLILGYLLISNT